MNRVPNSQALPYAAAQSPSGLRVKEALFNALTPCDHAQWQALGASSSNRSVFALPWFVQAVLAGREGCERFRLFIVEDGNGVWAGMIVLERAQKLGRLPVAMWQNLKDPNQFLGTPLVRAGAEEGFWRALLHHLDQRQGGGFALHCTDLPTDDVITSALLSVGADEGRRVECIRSVERAVLIAGHGHTPEEHPLNKRDKRLKSLERQLITDHGPLSLSILNAGPGLEAWISDFLALELQGWKGREGSAMASCPATEGLFRRVLHSAAAANWLHCVTLKSGGRTVALSAQFMGPGFGFGFKTSYDERLSRYAPGLLLLREITKLLHQRGSLYFDSGSTPDQASINGMWSARRHVADYAVSIKGRQRQAVFGAALAARAFWHRSKTWRA